MDCATQAAISDYTKGVQRRKAYKCASGIYFDALVNSGRDGYMKGKK